MSNLDLDERESGTSHHSRSLADHKGKQSGKDRIKDAATLHVNNIPLGLGCEEFKDIFRSVAPPIQVFLSNPSNPNHKHKWGFVEFSSYEEAGAVKSEFNKTSPYYFVINFAKMNRSFPTDRRHFSDNNYYDHSRRSLEMDPAYRGSSGREFNDSRARPPYRRPHDFIDPSTFTYVKEIQITVPENGLERTTIATFKRQERSSDLDDSFDDTSSVVNFTTRLVSLAQCQVCKSDALKKCPHCDTPYCSERCAADNWKHHKQSCKGGDNKSPQKNGPSHKEDLHQRASGSKQHNYHTDDESKDRRPHTGGHYDNKINQSFKTNHSKHQPYCKDESNERGPRNEAYSNNNKDSPSLSDHERHRLSSTDDETKERKPRNRGYNNNNNSTENFSSESQLSTGSYKEHSKSSNNVVSPLIPLTSGEYTQVLVTFMEEGGCVWVCKTSDVIGLDSMQSNLQSYCNSDNAKMVNRVFPGFSCAAFYRESNEWCRAEVISVKPKLKIRYIDYGNEDIISINNLRLIPRKLSAVTAMAFRIKLSANSSLIGTNIEFSSKLSIKPVEVDGNIWIVDLEPTSKDQSPEVRVQKELTPKNQTAEVRSKEIRQSDVSPFPQNNLSQVENSSMIADVEPSSKNKSSKKELFEACMSESLLKISSSSESLPLNSFFEVIISHVSDKFVYWVQDSHKLNEISSFLASVHEVVLKEAKVDTSHLKVGYRCAALFEEIWYRAVVLSSGKLIEVRFIDFGNKMTCLPDELRKLPDKYSKPHPYAFEIRLAPGTPDKYSELAEGKLSIKLVSKVGDSWLAHMANVKYDSPDVPSITKNGIDASNSNKLDVPASAYTLNSPIPTTCFTEVEITHPVNKSVYWVKKKADIQKFAQLFVQVNELCQTASAKNVPELEPGYLCGALFEDAWYRAEVLSIKPAIKVKFIDYGNEEICSRSDIRALPQPINDVPPFAFKISLAPGTPDKYLELKEEAPLGIKLVSKVGDSWLAHVANVKYDSPDVPSTPAKNGINASDSKQLELASVYTNSPIPISCFTEVEITHPVNKSVYWVKNKADIHKFAQLFVQVNELCQAASAKKVPELEPGYLCGALFEDAWYRAEVLSIKPAIKVKFIDYGNEEICSRSDIRVLPQPINDVPPFAFKISLAPGTPDKYLELKEEAPLCIKLVSKVGDSWLAHVANVKYDSTDVSLTPKNGIDASDSKQLHLASVYTNSPIPTTCFTEVEITHPINKSVYWVKKKADIQKFAQLFVEVNALCQKASAKDVPELEPGYLCGALFEDAWYRAEVLSIKPAIKVKFIDYGNEEICSRSDIRALPQLINDVPPFAFKISLASGTPDKYLELKEEAPLNIKLVSKVGDSWLAHVANVKYDSPDVPSTPAKNGVDASDSNKLDLASVYTLNSPIPISCFTEVEITHPVNKSVYWVKNKADIHKFAQLFVQVNELCQTASAKNVPELEPGFLCGALFEDSWYRAEVLSIKPAIKVMFIDYGNEEICSRSDIRALPQPINDVPPFAFKIQLAPGTPEKYHGLPESETISIKPISVDNGTWSVQVKSEAEKPGIKIVMRPNVPVPENSFTRVIISYAAEPNVYWVYKESDLTQLGRIRSELKNYWSSPSCASVSTPVSGSLVSALFKEDWYRGIIITTTPLKVKFIDYGFDEVCSAGSLKDIPPRLSSVPPLAFKVKLADGTSKKHVGLLEESILPICPVLQDGDCCIVRVEKDTSYELSENLTRSIPTENVTPVDGVCSIRANESISKANIHTGEQVKTTETSVSKSCHPTPDMSRSAEQDPPIPKNTFSTVVVTYPANEFCYWVTDLTNQEATEEMFNFLDSSCKSYSVPITELKSGIKCAAKFEGVWHRAKVVNVNPLKVKYVDFGNIEETSLCDIMELPPGVKEIKPRAFKIKMVEDVPKRYRRLLPDMHIEIKPISREADNSWLVTVPEKEKSDNSSVEETALVKEKKISFLQHIEKEDGSSSKKQPCSPPLKPAPSVISAETKNTFLPSHEFTEVLMVLKNGAGDYWATLKSTMASLDDMSNKLGSLKNEKAIPIVGKTYVHFYYDTWCRAKVVSLNPLTVFFIDYGNEGTLKESEIHPLPSEYASTPPYAFRIKMAEGTSDHFLDAKEFSTLKIKPVSRDSEGVYTVQIEGDKIKDAPPTTSSVSTKKLKDEAPEMLAEFAHMLDAAVQKSSCDLIVNRVQGSKIFSCSVVLPTIGDHKKYISTQIKKLTLSNNFREKVGSLVACKDHDGELGRGILLSAGDADTAPRVAMLDYGYTSDPCQLCPLPEALQTIPPAGVTCKLKEEQDYTSVGTVLKCSKLGYKGNNVLCEVDGRGPCIVSRYDPSQELPVLPTVSVKSGTMVTISAVTETCDSIYIQPLTEENAERLQSVTLQTNTYCNHGKGLTEEPKRGDIVGCLFIEDKRYYRAQVTNTKVNGYKVIFLDFGNTSEVNFTDLQPLSESLKVMPTCAVKVSLAGVDNVALIPEVKSFLEKYIDDSSLTFTMNFDRLSSVVLERMGSCLNDGILERLEAFQPVKRLMPESIEYVDWTTSKELNLIILETQPGNIFMVLNAEEPLVPTIETKLTVTLSDYARSFPSDYSYKPSINELVIACFSVDKNWYRAQCEEERNGSFKVFFLDYGNYDLVTCDNLRPMSNDHLQTPVVVRKCKIYGIPDVVRPEVQVKLNEMFSINSVHKAIILEETADNIVSLFCPQLKNKVDNKVISLPAFSLPQDV